MIEKFYEWMRGEILPELWEHYNLRRGPGPREIVGPVHCCVLVERPSGPFELMVLRQDDKAVRYATYLASLYAKYWIEKAPAPGPCRLRLHGVLARAAIIDMDPSFTYAFDEAITIGGDVPSSTTVTLTRTQ